MSMQTQRGIPVPSMPDPDAVPADLAAIAQFLDPGDLVPLDPAAAAKSGRIVFMLEGDSDPNALSIQPSRGTVFVDRSKGRIWLPLAQPIDGVSTLGWYRLGTDTDATIAALTAAFVNVVRSPLQNQVDQVGTQNLVLTGISAGQTTPFWVATVTYPVPFTVPPIVVISNADAALSPDVILGTQHVTANDFQVRMRNDAAPFALNAQVSIAWRATGS